MSLNPEHFDEMSSEKINVKKFSERWALKSPRLTTEDMIQWAKMYKERELGHTSLVRPIDENSEMVCLTSEDFEEIIKEMERNDDRLDADTAATK